MTSHGYVILHFWWTSQLTSIKCTPIYKHRVSCFMNCMDIKSHMKTNFVFGKVSWNRKWFLFPTLANESNTHDISQFADELKDLRSEFNAKFQDFQAQEVRLKIFSSPFDVNGLLQMNLIDLEENSNLKMKARDISLSEFYQIYFQVISTLHLMIWFIKEWHFLEASMFVNNFFQGLLSQNHEHE